MKRLTLHTAAILLFSFLSIPAAYAQIRPVQDAELEKIYGQSGITISASTIGFDITDEVMYYKGPAGIGGNTTAGVLSLCGLHLQGSATFGSPLTVDVVTNRDAAGLVQVNGVSVRLTDMTLQIDSFTIDSIRLGPAPGVGGELGSFGITNLTARMTGSITISAN
ncbi:hypothetical protein GMSM_34000 [Geomonas sp. Red276]